MDDLDEIVMQIERVTYNNEAPTIEGYEPIHTLQLNGLGSIQTEKQ